MKPTEWPTGASESLVKDCSCEWCEYLVKQLEDQREKQSKDGQHKAITSYD